jgi:hypothetical protein
VPQRIAGKSIRRSRSRRRLGRKPRQKSDVGRHADLFISLGACKACKVGRRGGATLRALLLTSASRIQREARARTSDPARLQNVTTTLGVDEHIVRHEALLFRMEVRDLRRFAVVAVG